MGNGCENSLAAPPPGVRPMYAGQEYLANNPGWHEGDGPWKAEQVARFLRDNGVDPGSICDLGCGTGAVLAELSRLMPSVGELTGFEPAPEAYALAVARAGTAQFVNGGVEAVDRRYDVALVLDVFEHVEDYLGFLRSLRGAADRFVFHIPLDMSVSAVLRVTPLVEGRVKAGHLHYFCRETALAALEESGYDVLAERFTPVGVSAPTTRAATKLLRVPRRLGQRLSPNLTSRLLGGFSLLVLARPAVTG